MAFVAEMGFALEEAGFPFRPGEAHGEFAGIYTLYAAACPVKTAEYVHVCRDLFEWNLFWFVDVYYERNEWYAFYDGVHCFVSH